MLVVDVLCERISIAGDLVMTRTLLWEKRKRLGEHEVCVTRSSQPDIVQRLHGMGF